MGQFNFETGKLVSALKKLGFHDVVEVALGAMETTSNEAAELKERLDPNVDFMMTFEELGAFFKF